MSHLLTQNNIWLYISERKNIQIQFYSFLCLILIFLMKLSSPVTILCSAYPSRDSLFDKRVKWEAEPPPFHHSYNEWIVSLWCGVFSILHFHGQMWTSVLEYYRAIQPDIAFKLSIETHNHSHIHRQLRENNLHMKNPFLLLWRFSIFPRVFICGIIMYYYFCM